MSYGTEEYGLSAYGGAATSISLALAYPTSTNSILVRLSTAPKQRSGYQIGDVYNPRSWLLQQIDPEIFFTIMGVRAIDPPLSFELVTLEPLGTFNRLHRISCGTLVSEGGFLITAPTFFDFLGTQADDLVDPVAQSSARRFPLRDIASTPGFDNETGVVGGHPIIGSDGDYETEEGDKLLKKLILRRCFTKRGGFYHLVNYGLDLNEKGPIDVVSLKVDMERQIMGEPDVAKVAVSVSVTTDGVVYLGIRAKSKNGQAVSIDIKRKGGTFQVL